MVEPTTLDELFTLIAHIPAEVESLAQNYYHQWQASLRAPGDSAATYPVFGTTAADALSRAITEFHSPRRRMVLAKAYTGPIDFDPSAVKVDLSTLLAHLQPPTEPLKRRF